MNFVISGDWEKRWENNDGDDFLMSVVDPDLYKPIPQEVVDGAASCRG